jgi:alkylation response protein AidB-like acyl-CoA dehydrogenase
VVTIAHVDKPGAIVTAHGGRLSGVKLLVPPAAGASHVVVVAGTSEQQAYYLLDLRSPGVIQPPIDSVFRNQHCLLELDAAPAPLLGLRAEAPARDLIDYVSQRVQFDQPIGRFQAVRHRCADMAAAHSGAQSLLYKAAWLLSAGKPAEGRC